MNHKALSWLLLVVAAIVCHFCLRYWLGAFQGYLTVPIMGSEYGFAHIKGATEWVSGRHLTYIPGVAPACALLSVVALSFAVRHTYRTAVGRRTSVLKQ